MTLFCTLSSRLPIIEFRTIILKKGGPCASGLFLSEGLLVFILSLSVDYNYYINLLKPTIQLELVKFREAFGPLRVSPFSVRIFKCQSCL